MRLVSLSRAFNESRPSREPFDQAQLLRRQQPREARVRERLGGKLHRRKLLSRQAQHRGRPRMGILDIEDRVVLRLLRHLRKIEIERLVVAPRQHDEAHDIAADLVDDIAQRDEVARALRHLHGLGPL